MSYLRHQAGDLTPREIVQELDKYVIGQESAKRAVAIALRNRWRRQQVSEELRDEIIPKNIIMIGPTGVGKTEIARRLAKLAGAPFVKVEASKFTEVGYVGRDVESMVRDLIGIGINLVREEEEARVEGRVMLRVEEMLIDLIEGKVSVDKPPASSSKDAPQTFVVGADGVATPGDGKILSEREILRRRIRAGELDDFMVEVELKDVGGNNFGPSSPENMREFFNGSANRPKKGGDFVDDFLLSVLSVREKKKRRVRLKDAMNALKNEEVEKLIDKDKIVQEALERTERAGIIFIDEIDKIAGSHNTNNVDVSRQGVQRDLLPIVEGSSVTTKHGVVKTDHILFIAAGAFHLAKPSDLIPELQGRFPIRVELDSLSREDFERILREPANSLVRQYIELMKTEGVDVEMTDDAISTIAEMASQVNRTLENIGARRLHTIMERVFEDLSFNAPEMEPTKVVVTAEYVREKMAGIIEDQDLSRYIL